MSIRISTFVILAVVLSSVGPSAAETNEWKALVNTTWDAATANWRNESGTPVVFADGVDALIGDASTAISMAALLTPATVCFDIPSGKTLALSNKAKENGFGEDVGKFVKKGAGTLTVTMLSSSNAGHGNRASADWHVLEGTVSDGKTANNHNTFGNRYGPGYVIHVGGDDVVSSGRPAKLLFNQRNNAPLKTDNLSAAMSVRVYTNGAFVIGTSKTSALEYVQRLTVEGGTVQFDKPGYNSYCALGICEKAVFSHPRGEPVTVGRGDADPGYSASYVGMVRSDTELFVPDITGDERADVIFEPAIGRGRYNVEGVYGFRKTGAGHLRVLGGLPVNNEAARATAPLDRWHATMAAEALTGDCVLEEGTLELERTMLSSDNPVTLTAKAGTRLVFSGTGAQVWPLTGNGASIVVSNATFDIALPGEATDNYPVFLGNLTLDDAVFTCSSKGSAKTDAKGKSYKACLALGGKLTLKGSSPYRLAPPPDCLYPDMTLQGPHDVLIDGSGVITNEPSAWPVSEIDVADIAAGSGVDATIDYVLDDGRANVGIEAATRWFKIRSGLRKTGAGTLRLTGASTYTGGTTVSGGTLLVDGSLAASSGISVGDGALLGGTGTVSAVSIAAGGGFRVDAADVDALAVAGDLGLAESGVVRIDGTPGETFTRKVCQVSGTLSGAENLEGWTVLVNGEPARGAKVYAENGVLYAKRSGGLIIILK